MEDYTVDNPLKKWMQPCVDKKVNNRERIFTGVHNKGLMHD